MDTSNPKASLVDAIKKSTNILVTVAHDPSVDALVAALGFSLMLNKLDKHATAVFSGAIPPAITFLEPEKRFEGTVDSLRDFIIAIDKEKADRLRYKVEGDVVRIYITPYRTTITEQDLQYSQGDFNVDLIIALGVEKQSDLDQAIVAHGRILHDATVATVNTSAVKSSIGTLDWSDDKASSLCEMLMSLSEALQSNLLDEQIATALLTGIVAATDRFSNSHTTPRVMTMSAQLMAAGANQQLIAEKLEAGGESLQPVTPVQPVAETSAVQPPQPVALDDGSMHVQHDDDVAAVVPMDQAEPIAVAPDDRLEKALGRSDPIDELQQKVEAVAQEQAEAETEVEHAEPALEHAMIASTDWRDHVSDPEETLGDQPLTGGTLNATASEAEEAKRAEEHSRRNHIILNHDDPAESQLPVTDDSTPDVGSADDDVLHRNALTLTKGKTLQPVTMPSINTSAPAPRPLPEPIAPPVLDDVSLDAAVVPPAVNQTLADLEAEVHAAAAAQPLTSSLDDARAAVSDAFSTQPVSVGGQPTVSLGVPPPPPPPPIPDFSTLPPLPPLPGEIPVGPHPATPLPQLPQTPPAVPAPGQFQIPGQ